MFEQDPTWAASALKGLGAKLRATRRHGHRFWRCVRTEEALIRASKAKVQELKHGYSYVRGIEF